MIKELFERYLQLKQYLLPISIGLMGFVLVAFGIISSFSQKKEDISFQNTTQQVDATSSAKVSTKEIIVDVEGAVIKPGVYHLSSDARLQDALIASGGVSGDADTSFIEKKINLAAKLIDGGKLYIPKTGEQISNGQIDTQAVSGQTSLSTTDQSASININDASSVQLDALPGIGQVTTQKIINGRPYTDTQELLTRKIVSTKVFNEIKDKITAN